MDAKYLQRSLSEKFDSENRENFNRKKRPSFPGFGQACFYSKSRDSSSKKRKSRCRLDSISTAVTQKISNQCFSFLQNDSTHGSEKQGLNRTSKQVIRDKMRYFENLTNHNKRPLNLKMDKGLIDVITITDLQKSIKVLKRIGVGGLTNSYIRQLRQFCQIVLNC